jgi:cytochrome-b5 reductase
MNENDIQVNVADFSAKKPDVGGGGNQPIQMAEGFLGAPKHFGGLMPPSSPVGLTPPSGPGGLTPPARPGPSQQINKSSLSVPAPTGLFPLAASQQIASGGSATGNPRNKVGLKKGFGLMDWVRLTKSGKDLTGVGGPRVNGRLREITKAELRKHKYKKDAWMALNGAVFNVTPYMDFHPGGWDELVKGAGKDATDLFNEVHRWVNYENMLAACLVGKLVDSVLPTPGAKAATLAPPSLSVPASISLLPPPPPGPSLSPARKGDDASKEISSPSATVLPVPPPAPPVFIAPVISNASAPVAAPTFDWFQSDTKITINIYSKRRLLRMENFIIDNFLTSFRVICYFADNTGYIFHHNLGQGVKSEYTTRLSEQGKLEITLVKDLPGRWQTLGSSADDHAVFNNIKNLGMRYRKYRVESIEEVTHDTKHFTLKSYNHSHMLVPTGYHIHIKAMVEGMEITRSYTAVPTLPEDGGRSGECLQFLIKIYPDGAITPILDKLIIGDDIEVSDYTGNFQLSSLSNKSTLYLIAAGTGITPMISLLPHLSVQTNKLLLNFNKTSKDVIWKEKLHRYAQDRNMKIFDIFSEEHNTSSGLHGRISKDLLQNLIQHQDIPSSYACICGPKGFVDAAYRILQEDFNFTTEQIHLFQG